MSNHQYEDLQESAENALLAAHLGITIDEYLQLSAVIYPEESGNYGNNVLTLDLDSASNPDLLAKIAGLSAGEFTMSISAEVINDNAKSAIIPLLPALDSVRAFDKFLGQAIGNTACHSQVVCAELEKMGYSSVEAVDALNLAVQEGLLLIGGEFNMSISKP